MSPERPRLRGAGARERWTRSSFEVIRNALVAATDEMVLALKRSAYSTNIKTRSDFSCAFFDARAAVGRAGVRAAGAPRLDERAGAERDPRVRRRARSSPATCSLTNEPAPERRAPERREPDRAGLRRGRAARLRREPRAPRRRRRRRARVHRRVPRGVPGGRDHPAGAARRGGRIVDDVFRLVLAQIRSKHETAGDFRAQVAANNDRRSARSRRWPRGTAATRCSRRWRSCSPTPSAARSPSSRRCRTASTRPRASSTTTATPTSRFACGRVELRPTARASTRPAPTRSAARPSTRRSR